MDDEGNPFEPKEKFVGSMRLMLEIREAGIDAETDVISGLGVSSLSDEGEFQVVMVPAPTAFGGALKNWSAPEVTGWRLP